MQEGILAVDLNTQQVIDVTLPEREEVAHIDVYWQDEVELNLDMSLIYVASGKDEINGYVENYAKPEIDKHITEKATEVITPFVEEHMETVVKPTLNMFTESKLDDINDAKDASLAEIEQAKVAAIEEIETKIDEYATKEEVNQAVENINVAIANVYTKEEADQKIADLHIENYYTKDEVYTKEEVINAIESATPEMTADKVEYINGSITSVQEALDQLLYVMPSITSFSGGGTYEVGQSISSINFAWALNKAVTSQSINQGIGTIDPSARSYAYTPSTPIRSNITYTLTVSDGKNTATKSTSLAFRYKRYWGVSTKDTLENADILALSKELTTGRTQSRTFNCSGGKYFYFVIPAEFCSGISFKVGGLAFSDMDVKDIALTNESGATVACKVYRSKNLQTGSAISVEVL